MTVSLNDQGFGRVLRSHFLCDVGVAHHHLIGNLIPTESHKGDSLAPVFGGEPAPASLDGTASGHADYVAEASDGPRWTSVGKLSILTDRREPDRGERRARSHKRANKSLPKCGSPGILAPKGRTQGWHAQSDSDGRG